MRSPGLEMADWAIYAVAIAALVIAIRVMVLDVRARRIARQAAASRATGRPSWPE